MKRDFILICLFLLIALVLTTCGSLQPTTTPVFTFPTVTEPPKTLIPIRTPSDSLSLTPGPESFLVTTRAGQEVRLKYIRMEPNEYVAFHTESAPYGIPMASGVEINFKYIAQADLGLPPPIGRLALHPRPGQSRSRSPTEPKSPTAWGSKPITKSMLSET